jgi:hypothetical protein
MKTQKMLFWITTGILFLFEGVMPLFTFNSEMAREGIRHLGYPEYFRTMLVAFKVLGAITLVLPKISPRIKEWAYAGFTFDFVAASISHLSVDGFGFDAVFPLIFIAILVISYVSYHRLVAEERPQMKYD